MTRRPARPEAQARPASLLIDPPDPRRVSVLLPLPLGELYDYAVPEGEGMPAPGTICTVPLGSRFLPGVVWDRPEGGEVIAARRLKPIGPAYPVPPMAAPLRKLIDWVAAYTLSPPGAVLRMGLSVPDALDAPEPTKLVRLTRIGGDGALTAARKKVLTVLEEEAAMTPADLARAAGVSPAVITGLLRTGWLESVSVAPELTPPPPYRWRGADFSDDQQAAADSLCDQVRASGFAVTLLDGVTGSGKTEVYFAAIAAALAEGKQVLVLLPEIALSTQWLERFRSRFGADPLVWHSHLTPASRRKSWRRIALGQAPVVVGARSALFLPLDHLGLIVVDEEHEASFKQEEGVLYNARDMAVVRARLEGVPILLASATPSLESLANVEAGRFHCTRLPERHGVAEMPEIAAIDLRRSPPPRGAFLSVPLRDAIAETLGRGEQAMLFLNRRGYAPLTLCRTCGYRFECPNCSAWLVEHRGRGRLLCHHCGHTQPVPPACPSCGTEDALVACGPGVERVAEEAAALFPDARLAVMASDVLGSAKAMHDLITEVQERRIDLLVGTQMMAKGHHFPHLTLVGIVDADLGLAGGDLRAGERTFQVLHQVAGRAGRAEHPGRVLMQTLQPEHPVIAALLAGDRDRFIAAEMDDRRTHTMPPYGRLAALILSAPSPEMAEQAARRVSRAAPHAPDVTILGPAPAPLFMLRGLYRWRFLIKTPREKLAQGLIRDWISRVELPKPVKLVVDIDPYNFL
ncbi:MAG: primosomal protein N' [Elstera sp.]